LHADRQLAATLANSAHLRIADEFTADKMAQRCLMLYRSLLEAHEARTAA
jgi:hypothetical protein